MKLINELTQRELQLLENIEIKITDKDYTLEEIIDISDEVVLKGEITAVEDKNESLAKLYGNLADKLIELEDIKNK